MSVQAVAIAITLVLFAAAAIDLVKLYRERRARLHAPDVVRRRIDELAAMPAPDELPRAPELTKADRRRATIARPRPRKRRTGRWG